MPDWAQVLDRAARAVGATYAELVLWNQPTEEPHLVACWGRPPSSETVFAMARRLVSPAQPLVLLSERDAQAVSNARLDSRVLPLLCAPFGDNQSLGGALLVRLPQGEKQELSHGWEILKSMAQWGGALLENQALWEELQAKEEQLKNLVRSTLDAQEAERERICLEVHDGVSQTLASAFHYLQTLESAIPEGTPSRQLVLRARGLVRQAIQESREVINTLQPATLRDLGLVATLRQEIRELEAELKWRVDFQADLPRLPKEVEMGLYRIIREAVTNAKKHSGTSSISVRLARSGDSINLEVRDWGCGFDPQAWEREPQKKGTGLWSMRKRAELLQGHCTIESRPEEGTTVRVSIPAPDGEVTQWSP